MEIGNKQFTDIGYWLFGEFSVDESFRMSDSEQEMYWKHVKNGFRRQDIYVDEKPDGTVTLCRQNLFWFILPFRRYVLRLSGRQCGEVTLSLKLNPTHGLISWIVLMICTVISSLVLALGSYAVAREVYFLFAGSNASRETHVMDAVMLLIIPPLFLYLLFAFFRFQRWLEGVIYGYDGIKSAFKKISDEALTEIVRGQNL